VGRRRPGRRPGLLDYPVGHRPGVDGQHHPVGRDPGPLAVQAHGGGDRHPWIEVGRFDGDEDRFETLIASFESYSTATSRQSPLPSAPRPASRVGAAVARLSRAARSGLRSSCLGRPPACVSVLARFPVLPLSPKAPGQSGLMAMVLPVVAETLPVSATFRRPRWLSGTPAAASVPQRRENAGKRHLHQCATALALL